VAANEHEPKWGDACDRVAATLHTLPDNPADTSADDLKVLAAAHVGVAQERQAITAAFERLGTHVVNGVDDHDLNERVAERVGIEVAHERNLKATERLTTYSTAALAAQGIDLDATT
jgi:hypothetical protein